MKKLVTIAAILSMFGSVAFANGRIQATVVDMRESYKEVIKNVPQEVCETVEVPVYKEVVTGQGNVVEGAIGGAILGAIAGEVIGGKNERNAGAIFGAIVGGDKAAQKGNRETVIVGYKQQQQCSTQYVRQTVSVRGDNVVTVQIDSGQRFQFNTKQWYKRGTVVFLNVSM